MILDRSHRVACVPHQPSVLRPQLIPSPAPGWLLWLPGLLAALSIAPCFIGVGPLARVAWADDGSGAGLVERVLQLRDNAAEAPLPDIDAIERGESPSASVSFSVKKKTPESQDSNEAGEPANAGSEERAREIPVRVTRTPNGQTGDSAGLTAFEGAFDDTPAAANVADSDHPDLSKIPELHTVAEGDTLWTLCRRYYQNPWCWPQLWALNPVITNPHWIFPGDTVRLRPADGAPQELLDTSPQAPGPNSRAPLSPAGLRAVGFLTGPDFDAVGRISGSREEKIMLTSGDSVYVEFPEDEPLVAGRSYSVFSMDRDSPVRVDGQIAGYMVRVHGEVLVDQIASERMGRGRLSGISGVVERGYLVSDRVTPFHTVQRKPSAVTVQSQILASFAPINMLYTGNFVVLSQGRAAGLQMGNRAFVVRRGDGYAPLMEGYETLDERFPKEVVAELLLVDVREYASVAWIARAIKEVRVGETAEARRGY